MNRRLFFYACAAVVLLLGVAQLAQTSFSDGNCEGLPSVYLPHEIINHINDQDWNEALDELIYLYEEDDGDENLRFYIALCYKHLGIDSLQQNHYEQAVEFFEAALVYVDDDPDLYVSLGIAHFNKSDYKKAESVFEKVLALDSKSYIGYKQLGQIYYHRNDMVNASDAWEKALVLNPEDTSLRNRLSKLQKQIKVSETFNTDANHLFSVQFDGESMPEMKNAVLGILEDAYYDVGARLKAYPKRQIAVTLLTRDAYFDITGSPQWTAGLYEGQIKIPVVDADYRSLRSVLFHEYVHAVVFDLMGPRCPWWLNEGLAQYYAATDNLNKKTDLTLKGIPTITDDLLSQLPGNIGNDRNAAAKAYAMANSAVKYLIDTYGEAMLRLVLHEMAKGEAFSEALKHVVGSSLMEFEAEWAQALNMRVNRS